MKVLSQIEQKLALYYYATKTSYDFFKVLWYALLKRNEKKRLNLNYIDILCKITLADF